MCLGGAGGGRDGDRVAVRARRGGYPLVKIPAKAEFPRIAPWHSPLKTPPFAPALPRPLLPTTTFPQPPRSLCQASAPLVPPRAPTMTTQQSQNLPTGPDYAEQKAEKADTLPQPASSKESHSTIVDTAQLWTSPGTVFTTRHLMTDVDPVQSTFPLAAYCFMTGFM